jgi:hypothetical protein
MAHHRVTELTELTEPREDERRRETTKELRSEDQREGCSR